MRRSPAPLGLLICAALGAALAWECSGTPKSDADGARPAETPKADDALAGWVDAVGDRALLTVVAQPEALASTIAAWAPRVARLDPAFAEKQRDPIAALEAGFGALPGWDRSRPIVAGLFEPAFAAPAGAITPQLPDPLVRPGMPPPLRHRILIPASDPAKLSGALTGALMKRGWRADGERLRAGPLTALRIFAEDGRTRVEIATGGPAPDDWSIPGGPSARTPAHAALVATEGGPLRALLRPWHLRAVFTQHGATQMFEALAMAGSGVAERLVAHGTGLLMMAEGLMHSARPEMDDWMVELRGDAAGVSLRSVISLTEAGAALLEGRGHAPLTPRDDAAAHLALAADLRGMLDAADQPTPAGVDGRGLARMYAECGPGCPLHTLTRSPLGGAKLLLAAAARETPLATLGARAPQVAFFGVDGPRPRVALAFQVPAGADLAPVRAAMAEARIEPAPELWTRALPDGTQAVVIGLGVGRDAFGDPASDAPLGRLSLRSEKLSGLPPELARVAAEFAGVEGRLDRTGRALIGQIRVGFDTAPTPPTAAAPIATDYEGPIHAAEETEASACLRRAERGAVEALTAVASAPPEMRGRLMAAALAEMEGPLSCAEQAPALAPAVKGLRRVVLLSTSRSALDGWRPAEAIARLRPLCLAGDEAICARLKAAEARPAPKLTELPAATPTIEGCPVEVEAGAAIRVTADAVLVDETPLAEVDPALLRRMGYETIQLGVGRDVPWSRVKPVLTALAEAGRDRLVLVAARGDGVVGVPAHLRAGGAGEAGDDEPLPDPRSALGQTRRRPGATLALDAEGATLEGAAIEPATLRAMTAAEPEKAVDLYVADGVPWSRVMQLAGAACRGVSVGVGPPPTPTPTRVVPGQIDGRALDPALLGGAPSGGVQAGLAASAALEKRAIKRVIDRNRRAIRGCYEAQLRLSPKLAGKVKASFAIQPDGAVAEVERAGGLDDPALWTCLRGVIEGMRFPAMGKVTRVTYPFIFSTD